jgi:TrmH family RNA methyltransferase
MPVALGLHSPQLDAVRALRTKAGRTEQGRFAIEGPTLLEEALRAGLVPQAVYATDAMLGALAPYPALAALAFSVPERAMARLSDLETPPGIVAVLPLVTESLAALLERGEPALLLAGIADPGNAGTLLRSAEIFGMKAAIFGAGGVDAHAPKVVRATMGAIFRLRIASAGPQQLLEAARRHGYSLVAATRSGTPLADVTFPARTLLAIGNERRGVGSWLPSWDVGVAIPQSGGGESLNAAVAGSIILYAYSQGRSEPDETREKR